MPEPARLTNPHGRQFLAFGVPSLDELLGRPNDSGDPLEFGIILPSKAESTSLCLIGPDGTGKSVLALHLASQYAALSDEPETRNLYVSTDLSFDRAKETWKNFALDKPAKRLMELERLLPRARASKNSLGGYLGRIDALQSINRQGRSTYRRERGSQGDRE